MRIHAIRSDDDHLAALRQMEQLWDATEGTPEGDNLNRLVALVEAYESSRWPIEQLASADVSIPNAETQAAMVEADAILRERKGRKS